MVSCHDWREFHCGKSRVARLSLIEIVFGRAKWSDDRETRFRRAVNYLSVNIYKKLEMSLT